MPVNKDKIMIGVVGCAGRMGNTLLHEILKNKNTDISGGTEIKGHTHIGKDLSNILKIDETGKYLTDNPEDLFKISDAIIDFTRPEATIKHAKIAAEFKTVHVIGTTGLSLDDEKIITQAADQAIIIKSSNMSLGVNILDSMVKKISKILDRDFAIEISETHHNKKVDAPSGTAIMLGKSVAKSKNIDFDHSLEFFKKGESGKRADGNIGFTVKREGNVVGEHLVSFESESEKIELFHQAKSRSIFAKGAVYAAIWGQTQKPGLYTMQDVLNLPN